MDNYSCSRKSLMLWNTEDPAVNQYQYFWLHLLLGCKMIRCYHFVNKLLSALCIIAVRRRTHQSKREATGHWPYGFPNTFYSMVTAWCKINCVFQLIHRGLIWYMIDRFGSTRTQGAVSIRKTVLPGMAIPMLKIRRPNGRLIFNMEIAIRR